MAVRIRLKRLGRKKKPFFRVVAIDSKTRREGAELERLGWYDPLNSENSFSLKEERIKHWVAVGAVPSHAVKGIFKKAGLSYKWHLEKEGKSQDDIDKLLEEWRARKAKLKTKTVEIPVEEDEPIEETSEGIEEESVQVSGENGEDGSIEPSETPESDANDSVKTEEPLNETDPDKGIESNDSQNGDSLELDEVNPEEKGETEGDDSEKESDSSEKNDSPPDEIENDENEASEIKDESDKESIEDEKAETVEEKS